MTRFALKPLPLFLWLGAFSLGCSGSPGTTDSGGAPLGGADGRRESLDPTKPGASLLCDSKEYGAALWVLSAMNHKLQTYPELAQAIGLDLVTDCETANRFVTGYAAYAEEHVDFDADEPRPPSSDVEPPSPTMAPPPAVEVSKIAGGEDGVVDHPVVRISFKTCVTGSCPNAGTSWVRASDRNPTPTDWRHRSTFCTATFIAKNWLLTAAHCINSVAIDSCMEHGDTFAECVPTWDTWGLWTIRGTRPNQTKRFTEVVWGRAYVHESFFGRSLSDNDAFCQTAGCGSSTLTANDDLALIYVPMEFDEQLTPNIEPDGAKRLNAVSPPQSNWNLAFYGYGDPIGTDPDTLMPERVLRRGTNFFDTFTVRERRIDVNGTTARPFACSGDSGGPMMRTGLEFDTNTGFQRGLEAVIGVTSTAGPGCATLPGPGARTFWTSCRVDHPEHRSFIIDTMHRYPQYRNFSCKPRGLAGLEAEECWGAPCTNNSMPAMGGCALATQTCVNSGREFAAKEKKFSCANCDGTPQQGSCDCMVGQCLSK